MRGAGKAQVDVDEEVDAFKKLMQDTVATLRAKPPLAEGTMVELVSKAKLKKLIDEKKALRAENEALKEDLAVLHRSSSAWSERAMQCASVNRVGVPCF